MVCAANLQCLALAMCNNLDNYSFSRSFFNSEHVAHGSPSAVAEELHRNGDVHRALSVIKTPSGQK